MNSMYSTSVLSYICSNLNAFFGLAQKLKNTERKKLKIKKKNDGMISNKQKGHILT